MSSSMRTGSRCWLLRICSISRKSLIKSSSLIRSSWAVLFVTLEYQSTRAGAKGLFVLDNLWDGLGALSVVDPSLQYYFGKVTMYNTYNTEARNMILYFLGMHLFRMRISGDSGLSVETDTDIEKMKELFRYDNFKDNYKVLNQEVRKFGINVPPLVNAYMSLFTEDARVRDGHQP